VLAFPTQGLSNRWGTFFVPFLQSISVFPTSQKSSEVELSLTPLLPPVHGGRLGVNSLFRQLLRGKLLKLPDLGLWGTPPRAGLPPLLAAKRRSGEGQGVRAVILP